MVGTGPLEVFHQLGGIETRRPHDREWHESNYVLVRNVYDDTIWVIWRNFIFLEGSADLFLSKDVLSKYALFPGMEASGETIFYAKIADGWDMMGEQANLRFSRIYRARSSRNQVEEPVVVGVV